MFIKLTSKLRPTFNCTRLELKCSTLLDTGAFFSVFTRGVDILKLYFPDATFSGIKVPIGGFGGSAKLCDVFIIPEITIGELTIYNLPVALQINKNITSLLILS